MDKLLDGWKNTYNIDEYKNYIIGVNFASMILAVFVIYAYIKVGFLCVYKISLNA